MSNKGKQEQGATVEAQGEAQGALSTNDVCAIAGAEPKAFRRWLRAQARNAGAGDALPGKGGRYGYTPEQAEALAGAYTRAKASKGTHAPAAAILAALAPEAHTGE